MSVQHISEVVCDGCGERSTGSRDGARGARTSAISQGWKHPVFGRDFCPKCPPKRSEPSGIESMHNPYRPDEIQQVIDERLNDENKESK